MERTFVVEVKVNSFAPPRVHLGNRRVNLGGGSTRKGDLKLSVAGASIRAKLTFSAPSNTAWSFKVKERVKKGNESEDKTLLDKSDTTTAVDFEFAEDLALEEQLTA